jgi:hypothetical protein
MRVKFLKDTTVEVYSNNINEDHFLPFKLCLKNTEIELQEIVPVSRQFSTLVLSSGEVYIDVKNDLFQKVVS